MSNTLLNKNQAGDGIWTSDNLVAGTNISITQVPQPVIDANTLGVWHFENGFDNAAGNSDYQITTADANFTSDYKKFGSYSQYDNKSSQYIFFPGKAFSNNFTLDFWAAPGTWTSRYIGLNTNGTAGSNRAYNGPLFVGLQGDSTSASISFNTISSSGTNVVTVTPNSWHHIAMEIENGTGRIYLDGELKYTTTGLNSSYYIHNSQTSGNGGSGIAQPKIDELRLSNIARYNGQNFTPYTIPYSASAGPTQYAINNTQTDPDLSGYLQNTATGTDSLTIAGQNEAKNYAVNIGNYSRAAAAYSVAVGACSTQSDATIANENSVAIGYKAKGTSTNSTVVGYDAQTISGSNSVAIGVSARANASNAVAIGSGSTTSNSAYANGNSVAVGAGARAVSTEEVAIGQGANTSGNGNGAVAVGRNAQGTGTWAIGIGTNAYATANQAIQLGSGTNNTANTFQVFNTTVVNASGKVPLTTLPIVQCTQVQYDALVSGGTVDSNTIYLITAS